MYIRESFYKELTDALEKVIQEIIQEDYSGDDVSFEVVLQAPKDKQHGDIACTTALQLASKLKTNPREIAQKVLDRLDLSKLKIEKAEIAGPGFINFFFSPTWLNQTVKEVLDMKEDFGKTEKNSGKTYNMEFVSANPTGPMHVGNARGAAIGDVLASIAEWTGYDVTREFYVNDAGNQINKLSDSLEARYQQLENPDYPFPESGYKGEDIKERVLDYLETLSPEEQESLKEESEETRKEKLSQFTIQKNLGLMKDDLSHYGVDFDVWFSEDSLYKNNEIMDALNLLEENGATYEKEGAIWFKATDYGLPKDDVLIRANGVPTYFMGDIAYHINKFKKREFDRGINIWGADHYGHVERLQKALEAVGIKDTLTIVLMQLVKLFSGGELVKMSKRTGQMITLAELVDDIGIDAARFFFNLRSPSSHLEFDLDLAIKETNENPVFYVQYAHARIASILRNIEDLNLEEIQEADLDLLTEKEELELIELLSRFPDEILSAESSLDPSKITHYAIDLASSFHSFYNACRVLSEDKNLSNARIALVMAVKQVLENISELLGITAPERM